MGKNNNNIYYPMWPSDDDLDILDEWLEEETGEREVTIPSMPWKDAYEANKTRETCILCGKKTIETPLFSSVVKTCACVNDLAKKDLK